MANHIPLVVIGGVVQQLPSGDSLTDIASIENGLVINEAGADVDFRVEASGNPHMLVVDAGLSAVRIGNGAFGNIADFSSGGIVFNEPGDDVDFRVESDNYAFALWVDAGANAVRVAGVAEFTFGTSVVLDAPLVTVNEGGADADFRVEGDTLTHAIFVDGSASTENIALLATAAPNWQTMDRGLFIGEASASPSGNPSSGVFAWVNGNEFNIRNSAGTVKDLFASGGGSGDVVGPASATDHAVARFDTATGKLLQDSVVIVGDTGIVTGITEINGGIVFNEPGADVDFRVEGDTASNLFVCDAGLDSVRVGGSTAGAIADFTPSGTIINDSGLDRDFRVEGDSLSHMIFADGTATTENIALLAGAAPNWQSMDGGLFIGASSAAPSGNPTSGTFLWSEGDELNIRNPSGTVVDLFSGGGGGGTTLDVQVFAASGTWTKPANAVTVHVSLIGGGGGGGSGRRGASSTTRGGGGGGGGGGYSYDSFAASALDATEAVTIGAGGAGGAGQVTNDTNGNAGSAGGNSEFDTIAGSLVANGGSGGGAGSTSSGSGGAGGTGAGSVSETGGAGGSAADGGSPTNKRAGAGGGAGAGLSSANAYIGNGKGGTSGGAGGAIGQTVFNAVTGSMAGFQGSTGFTGATVIAGTKLELAGGGGGGGGNTSTSSNGIFSGFGGDGGNFGAGGGGNAASLNNTGATSIGGGAGASGLCVVVTECST